MSCTCRRHTRQIQNDERNVYGVVEEEGRVKTDCGNVQENPQLYFFFFKAKQLKGKFSNLIHAFDWKFEEDRQSRVHIQINTDNLSV